MGSAWKWSWRAMLLTCAALTSVALTGPSADRAAAQDTGAERARPEMAHACRAPFELVRFNYPLRRAAERLAVGERLTVVAIGSSSTAGAGASSPAASYPSRLAVELTQHFPGRQISVLNRGVNGEDARDMLDRFESSVMGEQPDLVLWQVGTNSLLRNHSLASINLLIREGVRRLKASGADVVLIDPQFAPRVIAKPGAEVMVRLMSAAAKEADVDLFQRFAVMRHWHEVDNIPFTTFITPDELHLNDWSYACWAQLLGQAIADAVGRAGTQSVATRRPLQHRPAP